MISDRTDELLARHKKEAMREVRGQLSALSLEIAEKVLNEEFSDRERNLDYAGRIIDKVARN